MVNFTPEEKLLNLIKKEQGKIRLKKDLRLFRRVSFILFILIFVIAGIFLVDVLVFKYSPPEIDLPESEMELSANKDVVEKEAPLEQKEASIPKEDKLEGLHLLGIVMGDRNQAVIEDRVLERKYFLYKGDRLGEYTVFDIKEGSVTLDREGKKITLNM